MTNSADLEHQWLKVRATLAEVVPETECLLRAAGALESMVSGLSPGAAADHIREVAIVVKSMALQLTTSVLRVVASAERLIVTVESAERVADQSNMP